METYFFHCSEFALPAFCGVELPPYRREEKAKMKNSGEHTTCTSHGAAAQPGLITFQKFFERYFCGRLARVCFFFFNIGRMKKNPEKKNSSTDGWIVDSLVRGCCRSGIHPSTICSRAFLVFTQRDGGKRYRDQWV